MGAKAIDYDLVHQTSGLAHVPQTNHYNHLWTPITQPSVREESPQTQSQAFESCQLMCNQEKQSNDKSRENQVNYEKKFYTLKYIENAY